MEDQQPLWYIIGAGVFAGVIKLLDLLGVGDLLKRKTKANQDCEKEVAQLKMTVIRLHTSLTLIVEYLNNPANLEATKINLQKELDGLEEQIKKIKEEKLI